MTPVWLWKVPVARGSPQDSEGRMGSSVAWCADVKPAHGQEKGSDLEAGSIPSASSQ